MRRSVQLLVFVAGLLSACHSDRERKRIWRPSDHDQPPEQMAQSEPAAAQAPASNPGSSNTASDAMAAWAAQCARCHGQTGHGDGPMGSAVNARDLTDPSWQRSVSDSRIAESITQGRGMMPAFRLPAATIGGLVQLIRQMGGLAVPSGAPSSEPADPTRAPPK